MGIWYTRPVLFVAELPRAIDFYVGRLGFTEKWRSGDEVAQVDRDDCEIILSTQRPPNVGKGMLFIALTADDWRALPGALETKGVEFRRGWWGYRVLIVTDADGNDLYFPDPEDPGGGGPV